MRNTRWLNIYGYKEDYLMTCNEYGRLPNMHMYETVVYDT